MSVPHAARASIHAAIPLLYRMYAARLLLALACEVHTVRGVPAARGAYQYGIVSVNSHCPDLTGLKWWWQQKLVSESAYWPEDLVAISSCWLAAAHCVAVS